VNAGAGDDTVSAESLGKGVTVPQGSPNPTGAPGVLLYGAEGSDSLTGGRNDDVLIGGAGDDELGNDIRGGEPPSAWRLTHTHAFTGRHSRIAHSPAKQDAFFARRAS
jgi:Ca2+-binding RTX toxin-like protein